jgi:hypothetical protein
MSPTISVGLGTTTQPIFTPPGILRPFTASPLNTTLTILDHPTIPRTIVDSFAASSTRFGLDDPYHLSPPHISDINTSLKRPHSNHQTISSSCSETLNPFQPISTEECPYVYQGRLILILSALTNITHVRTHPHASHKTNFDRSHCPRHASTPNTHTRLATV